MKYTYVAIEGMIGAGKTTLAEMLSDAMDFRLYREQFEENPFLPLFYKDPKKYNFPLEMSFLAERYKQLAQDPPTPSLFDHGIISDFMFEKCLIFAKTNLSKEEFELFRQFYHAINPSWPQPQLLVYLYTTPQAALSNILKRGRTYEQSIPLKYLEKVQRNYLAVLKRKRHQAVLILDVSNMDFVKNQSDFTKLKNAIWKNHPIGLSHLQL